MPINIEYRDEEFILVVGRGVVKAAEIIGSNDDLYSGIADDAPVYQLVDLSQAVRVEVYDGRDSRPRRVRHSRFGEVSQTVHCGCRRTRRRVRTDWRARRVP